MVNRHGNRLEGTGLHALGAEAATVIIDFRAADFLIQLNPDESFTRTVALTGTLLAALAKVKIDNRCAPEVLRRGIGFKGI
jgi:hypothetical protein